jgi:tetratricopeptide (TPR) repeat protein
LTQFSIAEELLASLDQDAYTTKEELSRLCSNRALVYADLGEHELAETSFREAIALDEELSRTQELAINYTGLGNVQRDRGDYSSALRSYNEALGALTDLSERDRESDVYLEQGLTLILQDKAEQALPLLRTALLLTSVRHHAASHYLYLGEAYRAKGNMRRAADFFKTAAKLAQEYLTPETRWQALYKLALIAEAEGRPEDCKDQLEECIRTIENLRSQYLPESLKITLLARKADPYESMALLLLSRARQSDSAEERNRALRETFAYIELAKSRTFVEQLATIDIKPRGISAELLDEEASVLRSLRAFRALHTAEAAEQQYLWGQEIHEIENKLNEIWDEIREESSKGAEYVELRQAVPASYSSLRSILRNY